MNLLIGAVTLGLILALLGLGVFISYRIYHTIDLTADGSFGVGAAVVAALLLRDVHPLPATAIATIAGVMAGAITGILNTQFLVSALLAGVLTSTALYSVSLFVMGSGNLSLASAESLVTLAERLGQRLLGLPPSLTLLGTTVSGGSVATLILMALLVGGVAIALAAFMGTDLGLAMRAAGNNPQMAKAVAIDVDRMVVLGLGLSNGLIALAGALFAQYEGFSNIQMGIGALVAGLANLMVGEALLGRHPMGRWIAGAVAGAVVFRLLVAGCGEGRAEPERSQAGDRALRACRAGASAPGAADRTAGARRRTLEAMPDVALRLEAVSHVFHPGTPSEVRALDTVDLELEQGTFTVVVGTNGSGKSSLLNAIAGSLPLAGGRVYLDGREVTPWTEHRRARLISRVFQNPFTGTASDLSVAENLALAAGRGGQRLLRPALGRDRRRATREKVARLGMGLEDRLDTAHGAAVGRPATGADRAHGHDGTANPAPAR